MMHPELRTLLYDAEVSYLQTPELDNFKAIVASLEERLDTYECLRDQEIAIFQPVADQLLLDFSSENPKVVEQALKHWLSVMRYCAMAMLLNNPEFLQYRLLEWLTDIVQAHQMESLENHLYELLQANLHKLLTVQQLALVQPFLEQARTTLLDSHSLSPVLR